MTAAYPHLLAPGDIGTLALRNRILMCPMGDSLAEPDGSISDRQLAYFEARAAGGAALLLVGSVSVSYPRGSYAATQTAASHDRFVPGLATLARRAHDHGAAIAAQLVHDGANSLHDIEQGRPLLVPSIPERARPDRLSRMVTADEAERLLSPFTQPASHLEFREATDDDLAEVIALHAAAARRCIDAGFDAIELHGGHGYLLDAFRSGYANRRADRWGGPLENRARLMRETIIAVRAAVGPAVPVWMRLNAVEVGRPGGATLDETVALAPMLVSCGLDALHVSAYASNDLATGVTDTHTPHTPGQLVPYAAAVKRVVGVPVITFGRLEPDDAEQVLARGEADFVAMGRKLLADPDLPRKLRSGHAGDVRPCIYQYRCIGNIFVRGSIACVVNAEAAREIDLPPVGPPAAAPRRIVVAGAGPAGLECARRLATAGHSVVLAEAGAALGGRLALGALADPALARFLDWLVRGVHAAGVTVRLGCTIDATAAADFDLAVVATGARWPRPDSLPGADAAHVMVLDDLGPWLRGDATLRHEIVFLGGGKVALTLAAHASSRGHAVTVVEPTGVFGEELGLPGRFRLVHDLEAAGARLVTGSPVRITVDAVQLGTDEDTRTVAAGTVVVASGAVATAPLAVELRAAGIETHLIGDCRAAAGIEGTMLDASAVAAALARTSPA